MAIRRGGSPRASCERANQGNPGSRRLSAMSRPSFSGIGGSFQSSSMSQANGTCPARRSNPGTAARNCCSGEGNGPAHGFQLHEQALSTRCAALATSRPKLRDLSLHHDRVRRPADRAPNADGRARIFSAAARRASTGLILDRGILGLRRRRWSEYFVADPCLQPSFLRCHASKLISAKFQPCGKRRVATPAYRVSSRTVRFQRLSASGN